MKRKKGGFVCYLYAASNKAILKFLSLSCLKHMCQELSNNSDFNQTNSARVESQRDEVAEWLRRLTANQLGSARESSNLFLVELFLL
jgi:hypothetical protein